jgi:ATP-dependent exoDNAse (exonuclease V) alpha subunit
VRAGALGTRRIGAFVRDLLNPTGGGNASAADLVLPGSGGNNGGAFASQQQAPSLSLRRGDKVMQNTNNYDSDVFNGEVG